MKKAIATLTLVVFSAICMADTLLWQVNPGSVVHGENGVEYNSLYAFLSPKQWSPDGDANGNHYIYGARVNLCDANGNILREMEIENGNLILNSNNSPVDIGHPNSPNGVGATGISTDDNNLSIDRTYYYQLSILQGYHNKWNDNFIFQEIAWSALYSGELLEANGSYVLSDNLEEVTSAWIPEEFYTYRPVPVYDRSVMAPEPTTLVLMLLGWCVIGLRRKPLR